LFVRIEYAVPGTCGTCPRLSVGIALRTLTQHDAAKAECHNRRQTWVCLVSYSVAKRWKVAYSELEKWWR